MTKSLSLELICFIIKNCQCQSFNDVRFKYLGKDMLDSCNEIAIIDRNSVCFKFVMSRRKSSNRTVVPKYARQFMPTKRSLRTPLEA